ncbi:response regulator [Actinomadura rayongensis]|uniref:Response regulator n=1 Tax=Actinomadura rayongensis TaxID=1429076 RepID=A0A6I4W2S0_9ACTN|nr:response regulator [Actinomadura rayongensis]
MAIADDHPLVRAGFRIPLDSAPDIEVVGEAGNGGEAVALARRTTPDVVLMDVQMPDVDGLTATGRILADPLLGGTKVVMLTAYADDASVLRALRAGASGFLLKDVDPAELLRSIRAVHGGEALLAPSVTRTVIDAFVAAHAGPGAPAAPPPAPEPRHVLIATLTAREREVVRLVGIGLSNEEIADRLVLSPATVKTYVSRIMTKLAVPGRAQLVVVAYESGVVVPGRG